MGFLPFINWLYYKGSERALQGEVYMDLVSVLSAVLVTVGVACLFFFFRWALRNPVPSLRNQRQRREEGDEESGVDLVTWRDGGEADPRWVSSLEADERASRARSSMRP